MMRRGRRITRSVSRLRQDGRAIVAIPITVGEPEGIRTSNFRGSNSWLVVVVPRAPHLCRLLKKRGGNARDDDDNDDDDDDDDDDDEEERQ